MQTKVKTEKKNTAKPPSENHLIYKIEAGIPIPGAHAGREAIYPLDDLKVGESFFVPGGTHKSIATHINVFRGKNHGQKTITSRLIEGGIRVWRTK